MLVPADESDDAPVLPEVVDDDGLDESVDEVPAVLLSVVLLPKVSPVVVVEPLSVVVVPPVVSLPAEGGVVVPPSDGGVVVPPDVGGGGGGVTVPPEGAVPEA